MALYIPDSGSFRNLWKKKAVEQLKTLGTVDVIKKMAIVSLVGKQMKQFISIAETIFSPLVEQGINIEMINQDF